MNKIKYIVWAASLLIAAEVSAAVNIAVITPLSGEKAETGKEIAFGAEVAVNEINSKGGLNGEKIHLIKIEDECNDSLAVSTAQMMALNKNQEYKISAVFGPYCTNQFNKVAETLSKAEIFQIIPTAINKTFAENNYSGLIKMVGYKEQQAYDFFDFYNKYFNWMNVALIFDKQNTQIAETIIHIFNKNNKLQNIEAINFEENDFDYEKITENVLNNNHQMAFILGNEQNVADMARAIKSEKRKFIIFANKYHVSDDLKKLVNKSNKEFYFMGLPSLKNKPDFAETLVKLRLLGIEPEGLAVYGYSAVSLWADLVTKSGSFNYATLAQTFKDIGDESEWKRLMFSGASANNSINYSIYKLENDEYTQVH